MLKQGGGFLSLLKHAKNYLAADVASKAIGLISIPVFTRLLDPVDYGIYSVFAAYAGLIAVVLTLNAHTSVGRYFYESRDDFSEFVGTSAIVVGIMLCVSTVFILLFTDWISSTLALTQILVLLLIPFTLVEVCFSFFYQIFQPLRESALVARVNVVRVYVSFSISVALLLVFQKDRYLAVVVGQLAGAGLIACYLLNRMRPHFVVNFRMEHVRYICGYSLPLLFYTLNSAVLSQADRLMINKYCGSSDAGLYSLAYNLGMMLTLLSGALLTAWTPNYFENMDNGDYAKLRGEIEMMLKIITSAAVMLMLFGKDLGMLLSSSKYHSGLFIVPIVAFGCFFDAVWQLFGRHIGYSRKTIYLTYLGVASAAINIGLNMIFIPRYGYEAAAYTTLFSFFLMAMSAVVVTKYVIRIYPVTVKVLILPITCLLISVTIFFISEHFDFGYTYKVLIKGVTLLALGTAILLEDLKKFVAQKRLAV